jgi:hypothetical protein
LLSPEKHLMSPAVPLSLLFLATTLTATHAAVLSPPAVDFALDRSYGSVTGVEVFDASFLTASVPAFSSSLGTLESFTVTWTLAGSYSGILAATGGFNAAYSGPFLIAGHSLLPGEGSFNPGGGSGGGGPAGSYSSPLSNGPASFTQTFAVAEAGIAYDPSILTAVLGAGPVTLQWDTPLTIGGSWSELTVTGTASAAISYTYVAVPEASTLVLGISVLGAACLRRRRL